MAHAQGTTVAVGGALQDGNAEVWQRLVNLVQTPADDKACYSVITIASGEPDEAAARVANNLAKHGGRGEHLRTESRTRPRTEPRIQPRIQPRIPGQDVRADMADPKWIAQLQRCRGIFMTGGAQARLLDALQPQGQATPLLLAIRDIWRAGGVVAGTSAGAAVLSSVVFRDAPEPLWVMKGQLRQGQEWDFGFGFVQPGLVIDQHAVRRGRIARLLPLMQAQRATLGMAVEENSAAIFQGTQMQVLGGRGVLVADTTDSPPPAPGAFNLRNATLHWLESGDGFDLATRTPQPSARKLAGSKLLPLSPRHRGYLPGAWFYADMLGDSVIVTAMTRLVDGDQRELRGLAFSTQSAAQPAAHPGADDPAPDLAFEWRLWLDTGTRGWLVNNPDAYTLAGVRLDIVPVRLQRPLYQPILP